jgi:hypothetical protein
MSRALTPTEADWLRFLLPDDRPGYRSLRLLVEPMVVLGEGRWGEGDLVLGADGQQIDLEAGMEPVAAFGEIRGEGGERITLTLHQPDDEGRIEFQIGSFVSHDPFHERSRWSYSYWTPGAPSPSTGEKVREIELIAGELLLAIAPVERALWLFDAGPGTSTLLPITNFYNELVISLGIRDPKLALDHTRLFTENSSFSDADLRMAFIRYNSVFRKVDPERFSMGEPEQPASSSLGNRLRGFFTRGGTR